MQIQEFKLKRIPRKAWLCYPVEYIRKKGRAEGPTSPTTHGIWNNNGAIFLSVSSTLS